jgi:hypothetical protein
MIIIDVSGRGCAWHEVGADPLLHQQFDRFIEDEHHSGKLICKAGDRLNIFCCEPFVRVDIIHRICTALLVRRGAQIA